MHIDASSSLSARIDMQRTANRAAAVERAEANLSGVRENISSGDPSNGTIDHTITATTHEILSARGKYSAKERDHQLLQGLVRDLIRIAERNSGE
jgi:hypothetical protein